jgi:glycosyltransferase involved in cell wall biosynthesis
MLSILIPEYNCDCIRLVRDLADQCIQEKIDYEILVLDDASTNFPMANHQLSSIPGCILSKNEVNMGLACSRNRLVRMARFEWLLILDSDLQVFDSLFIKRYLDVLGKETVISGGVVCSKEKPEAARMLRWKYSRKRESLSAEVHNRNPWKSFFSSNILMQKSVSERIPYNEQFQDYGHEDTIMGYQLKTFGIKVLYIENPLLHLGIDRSDRYLAKSLMAVEKYLDASVFKSEELVLEVKIFRVYRIVNKMHLDGLVALKFRILKKMLYKNLMGGHPSLFLFDFYRLGHLCQEARSRSLN